MKYAQCTIFCQRGRLPSSYNSRAVASSICNDLLSQYYCRSLSHAKTTTRFSHDTAARNRISVTASEQSPIIIVGGGPTGLFLAQLLQSYKVPFLLLEAQTPAQRFQHPQAHFLNTRSMEILKHVSALHQTTTTRTTKRSVYEQVRQAMPPVKEWKYFYFGPDMVSTHLMMAKVKHPVDRPILANSDANGILLDRLDSSSKNRINDEKESADTEATRATPLSPLSEITVGHLAQHTFCKILYDAVIDVEQTTKEKGTTDNESSVLYGHRVIDCIWDQSSREWTVHTDQGRSFQSRIIIASDGARSFLRTQVLKIPMNGQATIQNLINVHFHVSPTLESRIPKAMLYTIFSEKVLAMIVRHGPGDYVMQIPYFPPYQTIEEDFTLIQVEEMVRAALGGNDNHNVSEVSIRSIRPWTMGSLVAQNYFSDKGVFVVGDAAHVFPPAGGFGMNTGMQDVFALAWRLALLVMKKYPNKSVDWDTSLSTIGRLYQQERQPVAQENAALSVRNYQRVLGVMQACYLYHQHPTALIAALNASAPIMPQSTRRRIFNTLFQTALFPLRQLKDAPQSFFSRRVANNLRTLLGSGQGLPLLFPQHELDFSYATTPKNNTTTQTSKDVWTSDSWSQSPRLAVGALFPHMPARVLNDQREQFPLLRHLYDDDDDDKTTAAIPKASSMSDDKTTAAIPKASLMSISQTVISTRDLALQLSSLHNPCSYCLLKITLASGTVKKSHPTDDLEEIVQYLNKTVGIPVNPVALIVTQSDRLDDGGPSSLSFSYSKSVCTLLVQEKFWNGIKMTTTRSSRTSMLEDEDGSILVLIRPDGHVAGIFDRLSSNKGVMQIDRIVHVMREG